MFEWSNLKVLQFSEHLTSNFQRAPNSQRNAENLFLGKGYHSFWLEAVVCDKSRSSNPRGLDRRPFYLTVNTVYSGVMGLNKSTAFLHICRKCHSLIQSISSERNCFDSIIKMADNYLGGGLPFCHNNSVPNLPSALLR